MRNQQSFYAVKNSTALLDYSFDWSNMLDPGDVIAGSAWDVPAGITQDSVYNTNITTTIRLVGGTPGSIYTITNSVTTAQGLFDSRVVTLEIVDPAGIPPTTLFPNPPVAISKIRRDRLMILASTIWPDIDVSDSYIWAKLQAAASDLQHRLRVLFVPTHIFPQEPTPEQITALNGRDWMVEPPMDYEAEMFAGDRWGGVITRNRPIISVSSMKFVYPTEANGYFNLPVNWLQIDKKYGFVRIVPTSNAVLTSMAAFIMMNLAGGRTIPGMVHIEYDAGFQDINKEWPEIMDLIYKLTVLKIISDLFFPQSGSISADGLSQSLSVDMSKYEESIDAIINGTQSSGNGGIMAALHGVRCVVA